VKRHGTVGLVAALVAMAAGATGILAERTIKPPQLGAVEVPEFGIPYARSSPKFWRQRSRGKPTPRRVKLRNPKHAKRRARHARRSR
jgi:hypothetical protein